MEAKLWLIERFGSAIAQLKDQKWDSDKLEGVIAGGESVDTSGALQVSPRADVTSPA